MKLVSIAITAMLAVHAAHAQQSGPCDSKEYCSAAAGLCLQVPPGGPTSCAAGQRICELFMLDVGRVVVLRWRLDVGRQHAIVMTARPLRTAQALLHQLEKKSNLPSARDVVIPKDGDDFLANLLDANQASLHVFAKGPSPIVSSIIQCSGLCSVGLRASF